MNSSSELPSDKTSTANTSTGHSASGGHAEAGKGSVSSRELLGGKRRLGIEHNGELYTLRITSNNKLILTK